MKKKFGFITLIAFVLVSIVLNVVVFLTANNVFDGRTSEPAFWLVWAFTFPLNLLISIGALLYLMRKSADAIIHVPITMFLTIAFFIIYVFVAFKFFFYSVTAINMTIAIIVEIAITAVYIIAIMFSLFALGYIETNQKYTKRKVLFIKLLKSDVDACIPFVKNPTAINLLNKLSEKIRFSDPMSHESLKTYEDQITEIVAGISAKVRCGEEDGIEEAIKKADILLDVRNDRCKILK